MMNKIKTLFGDRLFLEAPGHGAFSYYTSRILFRWMSAHKSLRVWVVGTRKWSLLIVKDDCEGSRLTPNEAASLIKNGID
jgi:hypothetical protein